jgi:hypothetical protein
MPKHTIHNTLLRHHDIINHRRGVKHTTISRFVYGLERGLGSIVLTEVVMKVNAAGGTTISYVGGAFK